MYIQYIIKFLLHKRHPGYTDGLNIRLRVTLHGLKPLDFPTGISTSLSTWDAEKQRLKRSADEAAVKNRTLEDIRNRVEDIFARFELVEHRVPTLPELKAEINTALGRSKKPEHAGKPADDFFTAFDAFTEQRGMQNQWTHATYEKFAALRAHLVEFNKDITFADITEETMQRYLRYLNRSQFRNTTIAKHLAFFRWFLRWAADKGYYTGTVHATFRPKLKGTDGNSREVIYLSIAEVKKLAEHQFLDTPRGNALERVRDVLLFCCFTGLRYSDVKKLKKSDIRRGCIYVVTQKTVDGLKIELNDHSRAILEKYAAADLPDDAALPVISNAKMNEQLKTLGRECKITEPVRIVYFTGNVRHEEVIPKWQLLTTHVGRRTFVVTALQLGIASEVIMKWTGHSDFSAMKPYVKIVDDLKAKEMTLFNNL